MNPIKQISLNLNIHSQIRGNDPSVPRCHPYVPEEEAVYDLLDKLKSAVDNQFQSYVSFNTGNIFEFSGAAVGGTGWERIFNIPPLFCLDREEVPFDGPNDPSLDDEEKLQEFADLLSDRFQITKRKMDWTDRASLRGYLQLANAWEKIADIVQFIVMHEIGHTQQYVNSRRYDMERKFSTKRYQTLNILSLGILKKAARDKLGRTLEREADEYAYKTSHFPNPEGGYNYFKALKDFKPKGFKETLFWTIQRIDSSITHGSFSSRMRRIEQHISSDQGNVEGSIAEDKLKLLPN